MFFCHGSPLPFHYLVFGLGFVDECLFKCELNLEMKRTYHPSFITTGTSF